jgi:hypothetical protein
MREWQEQEDGRADEAQQGEFVIRGILLEQGSVLGAVSFGPARKFRLTDSYWRNIATKTTSKPMVESSAGYTEQWDSPTLQEISDSIVTIITALISLVDSFVCNVIATSSRG